ncbi:hypothetical protein M3J09_004998 [Ascochyta lentis]
MRDANGPAAPRSSHHTTRIQRTRRERPFGGEVDVSLTLRSPLAFPRSQVQRTPSAMRRHLLRAFQTGCSEEVSTPTTRA